MEFSIESDVLKKEVSLLQGIAEKKSGIAALSSLLIEATKDGVRITGTDLAITVQADIEATVKKEGDICVPAKKLYDIARNLREGTVKFKKDDNNWVRITCNKSKFRMTGLAREHFPVIPTITSDEVLLDADLFKSMVKHTCFATTQEESRFALGGAKLEIADGKATMVATDGHRIALVSEDIEDPEASLDILVPKKALLEVVKFADGEVEITHDANHLKFVSGDRLLISRKMAMNFPDYKRAIPKDNNIEVSFSAEDIVGALKRVAIMSDERNRSVKIEVTENKMTLSTAVQGESEEVVDCTTTNLPEEGVTIHLNGQYLMEFFLVCENPTFYIKDGLSASVAEEGTAKYVIMPLRG